MVYMTVLENGCVQVINKWALTVLLDDIIHDLFGLINSCSEISFIK